MLLGVAIGIDQVATLPPRVRDFMGHDSDDRVRIVDLLRTNSESGPAAVDAREPPGRPRIPYVSGAAASSGSAVREMLRLPRPACCMSRCVRRWAALTLPSQDPESRHRMA